MYVVMICRETIPYMKEQGGGRIINNTSFLILFYHLTGKFITEWDSSFWQAAIGNIKRFDRLISYVFKFKKGGFEVIKLAQAMLVISFFHQMSVYQHDKTRPYKAIVTYRLNH